MTRCTSALVATAILALAGMPNVADNTHGSAATCSSQVVAGVEIDTCVADPTAPLPTLDELRDFIALSLNPTAAPRELHVLAELPRRGIGKVDRRALRERYSDVTNP